MQKHPEGQIGRLKESGKSLPDHSWDPCLQGLVVISTSYYAHTRCDTIIYYTLSMRVISLVTVYSSSSVSPAPLS